MSFRDDANARFERMVALERELGAARRDMAVMRARLAARSVDEPARPARSLSLSRAWVTVLLVLSVVAAGTWIALERLYGS